MRQLTLTDDTAKIYALAWLEYRNKYGDKPTTSGELEGFNAGFTAGLDYQQAKIEALEAQLSDLNAKLRRGVK